MTLNIRSYCYCGDYRYSLLHWVHVVLGPGSVASNMLDERSTHSATSLVHFPFKTWSRPLGSFSSPSLLGQLVKGDTELLNGFLKVIKQVRSRSRHWSSGPGSIIHSRQAGPSNIYILKLRNWHYHIAELLVWFLEAWKKKLVQNFPLSQGGVLLELCILSTPCGPGDCLWSETI